MLMMTLMILTLVRVGADDNDGKDDNKKDHDDRDDSDDFDAVSRGRRREANYEEIRPRGFAGTL